MKDIDKFWVIHKRAKRELNEKLAKLPLSEKAVMAERLQADYELLQNARDESKQFGLGELPLKACNVVKDNMDFSRTIDSGHFLRMNYERYR